MTLDLFLVLALLGAAIVMFVMNRPRMDVVAAIMMAALPLTGVITVGEAIAGFADPNIVLIAFLFILGEGLVRTGVARRLGDWINKKAGGSRVKLIALLMVAVAGLGSAMSSTAVVAIFIPVVLRICRNTGTAPSQLMMPVSFAALISGMMTLVATAPNLVVNAELMRQGEAGFGFFTITPFGLAVLVLGVLYMLVARRWLPNHVGDDTRMTRRPTFRLLIDRYNLHEREYRVRVRSGSKLIGRRLEQVDLRESGINLLAIERGVGRGKRLIRPVRTTELMAGDILLLDVRVPTDAVPGLIEEFGVEVLPLGATHRHLIDCAQDIGMVEAIVPAESGLVGKTVLQARVRSESGLTVVGLRRGQEVIGEGLLEEKLQVGDTLLVIGFWSQLRRLQQDTGELVPLEMPAELDEILPAHDKAPQALGILALVVVLMVTGIVPNVHAVLLGCLLLGLTRLRRHGECLSVDQLAESGADRRHDAVLDRLAADGRCRSRGLRPARAGGRGLAAADPGGDLRHHRGARHVHLEHRDRHSHGADRAGGRCRSRCLALSLRDDRGAGGVHRLHDPGLVAGEHAGGGAGQLPVRGFHQDRRAVQPDFAGRLRAAGARAAAVLRGLFSPRTKRSGHSGRRSAP